MLDSGRAKLETDDYKLEPVEDFTIFAGFSCGDCDLDEFIEKDAEPHRDQLLAETYGFYLKNDGEVSPPVAYMSLMNDVVQREDVPKSLLRKLVPYPKRRYQTYPAVKIGRLAVSEEYKGMSIGTTLIALVKNIFTTNNRTGCRFVTLDAYRDALEFYQKNDFIPLHEEDLKGSDSTVLMYFDLLRMKDVNLEEGNG